MFPECSLNMCGLVAGGHNHILGSYQDIGNCFFGYGEAHWMPDLANVTMLGLYGYHSDKCAPLVLTVFPEYCSNVPRMFSECASNVPFMLPSCSLNAP
jgi:hypothetical protein